MARQLTASRGQHATRLGVPLRLDIHPLNGVELSLQISNTAAILQRLFHFDLLGDLKLLDFQDRVAVSKQLLELWQQLLNGGSIRADLLADRGPHGHILGAAVYLFGTVPNLLE